jgi:tetratricopeptide (TPR) repeat protein
MVDSRPVFKITVLAVMVFLLLAGCATGPNVADGAAEETLDPGQIWQRAEEQHAAAIQAVANRRQLQNDYETVIRLSRDGDLRGRAFVRRAELNLALGEYEEATDNLVQSLRAGLNSERRSLALLLLADVSERYLLKPDAACTAYQQVINEYPASAKAETARLRMGALDYEC